ncbi:NADPH2:quinone reductase [Rhizobium sp. BK313]|uniref:quinone oxidoreductase family protein n=1 Tax=Rhizobium sp. BK313 TaxID=2587081 RepID=UPI001060B627|nr:zinc-binding dehydrogenase [Rhizobium sp. BK313]MBB3458294.1 NADPH2:quinone reductase [Rhizobium sp. BK313]
MSDTMTALAMTEAGGPEVLHIRQIERPQLQRETDILVRVKAAGVNPADWQNRKNGGGFAGKAGEIIILGIDGVGVVEAVGAAVHHFKVGDEVWYIDGGYRGNFGSYAELKVLNGDYATLKPKSLGFVEAAGLPVAALTAWEAVYEKAEIKPGDFVLIHGGAGGLGHLSIQLALSLGARVAATVSNEDKAAFVRKLGVERAINYKHESVVKALQAWTGKEGADHVFDFVGHGNFANSFEHVAPYGSLINTVVSDWPRETNALAEWRNIDVKFVNIGYPQIAGHHEYRLQQTAVLKQIAELVDSGKLTVHIDRVVPFAGVGEAHTALETGATIGRVVLDIGASTMVAHT